MTSLDKARSHFSSLQAADKKCNYEAALSDFGRQIKQEVLCKATGSRILFQLGRKDCKRTSQWNFKELIKPKSSFFYVTLLFIQVPPSAVAQLGLAQLRLLIPSGERRFPFSKKLNQHKLMMNKAGPSAGMGSA